MILPGAAAEQAVWERLRAAATDALHLGTPPRVGPGWPDDVEKEDLFPRVGIQVVSDVEICPGYHRVRIAIHSWAWPSGKHGNRAKLHELDRWSHAQLSGAQWAALDHTFDAVAMGSARDFTAGGKSAMRRSREYMINASSTS